MNAHLSKWNPDLYDEKHAFVSGYGEDLVRMLDPKAHERVLDLGCGTGQLTAQISMLAKEVIGIDKSPEMISQAMSKFPDIQFLVGSAEDFKFDKPFDAIFSNATLHWVKGDQQAAHCMYKHLRPGGKVVLEFGGQGNVQTIIDQLRSSLRNRGYLAQSQTDLWYFPTIGEYATVLEAEGFRVRHAQHYDRPTELADAESGIQDWLSMFAGSFFRGVEPLSVEAVKVEVQARIKDKCLVNGKWYADYKRLRVVATREG